VYPLASKHFDPMSISIPLLTQKDRKEADHRHDIHQLLTPGPGSEGKEGLRFESFL